MSDECCASGSCEVCRPLLYADLARNNPKPVRCWCLGNPTVSHLRGVEGCKYATPATVCVRLDGLADKIAAVTHAAWCDPTCTRGPHRMDTQVSEALLAFLQSLAGAVMTNLVPSSEIERIVGATRHEWKHQARAASAEQTVYILHSQQCLDSGIDLRDCEFSRALDRGINPKHWRENVALIVEVINGALRPYGFSDRAVQ
jgi:hypothetical protein